MVLNIVNKTRYQVRNKEIEIFVQNLVVALKKKKVLNQRKLSSEELTLVFVSQLEMKKINGQFRGKNKPTDVLSFESLSSESLGDLIFCPQVLLTQSKEYNHTLSKELAYMLIHGILHLLGYDHETSSKDEKKMFQLQDALFQELTQKKVSLIVKV